MRSLLLCTLLLSPCLLAQSIPADNAQTAESVSAEAKLHASAAQLVDLWGVPERMSAALGPSLEQDREQMRKMHPDWNPAFADEWVKRMQKRATTADYVEIVVKVYEKHLSQDEIDTLIQAQFDIKASKPPQIPAALKEKRTNDAITIQSEILGGCTQFGAKLGGEIGQEISQEHPDWVKGN